MKKELNERYINTYINVHGRWEKKNNHVFFQKMYFFAAAGGGELF